MKSKAKEAARKLCAYGGCIAGYIKCGNPKGKGDYPIPLIGKGTTCPLAKYEIPYDNTPWHERPKLTLTSDEISTICAECDYQKCSSSNEDLFMHYCIDCPVQLYIEKEQECEVEAVMS